MSISQLTEGPLGEPSSAVRVRVLAARELDSDSRLARAPGTRMRVELIK